MIFFYDSIKEANANESIIDNLIIKIVEEMKRRNEEKEKIREIVEEMKKSADELNGINLNRLSEKIDHFKSLKDEIKKAIDSIKIDSLNNETLNSLKEIILKVNLANRVLDICEDINADIVIDPENISLEGESNKIKSIYNKDNCINYICNNSESASKLLNNIIEYIRLREKARIKADKLKALFYKIGKNFSFNVCDMGFLEEIDKDIDDNLYEKINHIIDDVYSQENQKKLTECKKEKLFSLERVYKRINEAVSQIKEKIEKEAFSRADLQAVLHDINLIVTSYDNSLKEIFNDLGKIRETFKLSSNDLPLERSLSHAINLLCETKKAMNDKIKSMGLDDIDFLLIELSSESSFFYELVEIFESRYKEPLDKGMLLDKLYKLSKNRLLRW